MQNITAIVCCNKNNSIGKDLNLIYHIKDDLKRFKNMTENNVVIMGRKTFESLPNSQPLKNRINIILTKDKDFFVDNDKIDESSEVYIVHSIEDLKDVIEAFLCDKKIFLIGGAEIYKLFIDNNLVDRIEMTFVDDDIIGDKFFPILDRSKWIQKSEKQETDSASGLKYQFITFIRK